MIYNKTWQFHIAHVDQVLQLLMDNQIFLKRFNCAFSVSKVVYLVHIVSQEGVHVDLKKIEEMENFPHPKPL